MDDSRLAKATTLLACLILGAIVVFLAYCKQVRVNTNEAYYGTTDSK